MQLKLSKYFLFKIIESKNNFHKELFLLETLVAKITKSVFEYNDKMQ